MHYKIEEMLQTHPRPAGWDIEALIACIQECFDCAQACTACADACLGEESVRELVRCIRLNLDCSDVCTATGSMLSRQTETDLALMRHQLQTCVIACRDCGEECRKHAGNHKHCEVCADSCLRCEDLCNHLLKAMPT